MKFMQIIEYKTSKYDEVSKLVDEWFAQTAGRRSVSQGTTGRNREEPDRYFDVIVFPDQSVNSITQGYRAGAMPEQYTGGLDDKGAENLKEFVNAGGTLVFLNHSTDYALAHLGVNVKNVVQGVPDREFYSPGSILNAQLDPNHPLAHGVPAAFTIWSEGSPAWDVPADSGYRVVSRYPGGH